MGLDGVEFVMELEERFDIEITESDLEDAYTFGDFYRTICAKVRPTLARERCPTPGVFLRLRRALGEVSSVDASRVRLDTPVADLIPAEGRLAVWSRLEKATGFTLPSLAGPEWTGGWFVGGCTLAAALGLILGGFAWWLAPVVWTLGVLWGVVWERKTRHLAGELPKEAHRVRDLVGRIEALNPPPRPEGPPSRDTVWREVVRAAAQEFSIPVEYVRPDAIISDVGDWQSPPGIGRRGCAKAPPRTHPGGIPVDVTLPLRRPNIVLDLEHECGVRLTGHELRSVHTVWDLYQLTLERRGLRASQPDECPSAAVFSAVRRVLVDEFCVPRAAVRLDARLATVIPARRYRKAWAAIRRATGLRLPGLETSPSATSNAEGMGCLFGVPPALLGAMVAAASASDGGLAGVVSGVMVGGLLIGIGVAIAVVVYRLWMEAAQATARGVPDSCETLAGLVRETVELNHSHFGVAAEAVETLRIWDCVLAAIAKHCRLTPSELVRGSTPLDALATRAGHGGSTPLG